MTLSCEQYNIIAINGMPLLYAQYDIIGHSGEGPKFDMVTADNPPKNNKERLTVLKVRTYT